MEQGGTSTGECLLFFGTALDLITAQPISEAEPLPFTLPVFGTCSAEVPMGVHLSQ